MQVKIIDDEFFSSRREIVERRALFPFVPLIIIQQTEYRKLGRRTVKFRRYSKNNNSYSKGSASLKSFSSTEEKERSIIQSRFRSVGEKQASETDGLSYRGGAGCIISHSPLLLRVNKGRYQLGPACRPLITLLDE